MTCRGQHQHTCPRASRLSNATFSGVLPRALHARGDGSLMDNKLPILVFDMNKPGNLVAAVMGEAVGTLVN